MKRFIIIFILIPAFSLFLSNCDENDNQNDQKKEFKIGAILPLTGNSGFLGEAEQMGLELAMDEIKKEIVEEKLNLEIEILYEDSKNQNKEAINAFNNLYNLKKIDALIVTHSGVCGPISEYLTNLEIENKIPVIGTIVASTKITQNNELFFRLYPSGAQEAIPMANYAMNELQLKKFAIYYQNDDYGLDGLENFKNQIFTQGGEIVWENSFDKSVNDHKNLITKLNNSGAEAVYVIGNTPAYALVLKQLKELSFKGSILTGTSLMVPSLQEKASNGIINAYFTATLFDVPDSLHSESAKKFVESFNIKYDKKPSFLAAYTYSSLKLIFESIKLSTENNNSVYDAFSLIKKFNTPIGEISFQNREAILPIAIQKFNEEKNIELINIYNQNE